MIPLYGFLEGDTLGLLILANEDDTMDQLAEKLQRAADVRVAPRVSATVVYQERDVARAATVAALGMQPLERFDVVSRAGVEVP